jgi:hypothetical protein
MSTEQERMERARQKLLNMNRKVQRAQDISKKRQPLKPLESASPPPAAPPPPPKPPTSTYIFELTESLLADGFTEDEVVQYVALVEQDSKCSDIDLDQRELVIQAEVKKINRAIARIKDPKPPTSPEAPPAKEPSESDVAPAQADYAEIRQARQNPSATTVARKAPLSPHKPDKKMIAPKAEPERPAVKATGAGAKFLADLADDDDGGLF